MTKGKMRWVLFFGVLASLLAGTLFIKIDPFWLSDRYHSGSKVTIYPDLVSPWYTDLFRAQVMNPDGIDNLNFMDYCRIGGKKVSIEVWTRTGWTTNGDYLVSLIESNPAEEWWDPDWEDSPCPKGTLFFLEKKELLYSDAELIQRRKEEERKLQEQKEAEKKQEEVEEKRRAEIEKIELQKRMRKIQKN